MPGPWTVGGEVFVGMAVITTVPAKIPLNQTDYNYYYPLSLQDDNFWATLAIDGGAGSLRVTLTDGTTQVPVDFRNVDIVAKTGSIWWKGDPSASAPVVYKLFFGNLTAIQPAIDATYGRENTYLATLRVVHALNEDPTAGGAIMLDRTVNAEHGTPIAMDADNIATGFLEDNAVKLLNGESGGINSPWVMTFGAELDTGTITMFIKVDTATTNAPAFWGLASTTTHRFYFYANVGGDTNVIQFYIQDTTSHRVLCDTDDDTGVSEGTWVRVDVNWLHSESPVIASNVQICVDGVDYPVTYADQDRSSANTNHAYPCGIGYNNFLGVGPTAAAADTYMQEFHVHTIRTTDEWREMELYNLKTPEEFFISSASEGGYPPVLLRSPRAFFI